jgi:hypothetical protein
MKQNMIAVSEYAKNFILALCAEFPDQPGKGEKPYDLTQREAMDALVEFAAANRETIETDEEGNETVIDGLALEVRRTLALRGATVRANSAISKLAEKEKELEELRAQLAKLQGVG